MDEQQKKPLEKIANTIRVLSAEAVERANSGHPGMPMGCAELGAYLYGVVLRHTHKSPRWLNRDRLVLSAGHGSMWLYSCLHLSGFKVSLEDIKNFRKLHSITPGHPEFGMTEGVEATTGPLGQGVGNAVGIALGLKLLAMKFNKQGFDLFNSKVYCVAGDGCIMEGVSSEVSSLAGHLGINNLVLLYDSNHICLDGPVAECCSENTKARYLAYGWDVHEIDGYDFAQMETLFSHLSQKQDKPAFVIVKTIIGKGSQAKAGTSKAHGSPLGKEEISVMKESLGLPKEEFYVPQSVYDFFKQKQEKESEREGKWKEMYLAWSIEYPELANEFETMQKHKIPSDLEKILDEIPIQSSIAGRAASQAVLNVLGKFIPCLVGGSADLSVSDLTMMKEFSVIKPRHFEGRNLKYGVREFGMSTIASGLFLTDMWIPFIGTFLTFSDYMRNAIRLAALSRYHIIYQFTHDSIFLGEDGPTHQPIEHLAALRAIPNLHVIRPADAHEVKKAWLSALQYKGPTAIILSRQNLCELSETRVSYEQGVARGAYIVRKEKSKANFCILATGSELFLALEVAERLEKMGKQVRVVSFPCWQLFDVQADAYQEEILGGEVGVFVSIEAAGELGWHKYIGRKGIAICTEGFGASAPMQDIAEEFGFTVDKIVERLLAHQT